MGFADLMEKADGPGAIGTAPVIPATPPPPQRLVVLIPGIHEGREKALRWMQPFADFLASPGTEVLIYTHAWLSALATFLPGIGNVVREHQVRKFQVWLAATLVTRPGAVVDAVGHSFGGYIPFAAMTAEGGPGAVYRRLALMAATVSSREDFKSAVGHFQAILNLYSTTDTVVLLSTIGQAGRIGFANGIPFDRKLGKHDTDPMVRNLDCTPYRHRDYENPGEAWDAVRAFLAT
jgi:hypothetical protein